ncbi:MAG TPA: ATP-binding protein [Chlamydiales bacterium]|nr:ATP-binding protein [Chlamydiales bacterium]HPE85396.1 ATP-binding protein [Chlamydiales bacterium]
MQLERFYCKVINMHFQKCNQMVFLVGPRQAGKTTASKLLCRERTDHYYLNWDNLDQRTAILKGPKYIAELAGINELGQHKALLVFDEIHKYKDWKNWLKGFYDTYAESFDILVTGSAKIDVFRKGGDSLMGRYFCYRLHPLSVREVTEIALPRGPIRAKPIKINDRDFDDLWKYGGFPDPYLAASDRRFRQWQRMRHNQLFNEDIRDLTRIQDLDRLEILMEMLKEQAGSMTSVHSLATKLRVSDNTVKNWLKALKGLYYCFEITPWSKNVIRSLIKEPKYYLWDWSLCKDSGARAENFIASHLLKAVHFWNDYGFGEFGLYFVRNKDKKEVDFLVSKDNKPWFLVEVKAHRNKELSPALIDFHRELKTEYALQVVVDLPYVNKSCFASKMPIIVPAKTFLSQLI